MRPRFTFSNLACLWLLALGFALPAHAARPLSDILYSVANGDWEDVKDTASWQAANDGPRYLSAPGQTPQYESFEGDWEAPSADAKLAIFSDDGCDVFIDGQKVHGRLGKGQGLPNLSESLYNVNFPFQMGRTYHIKVDYSNTYYLGNADIDGCTLFVYEGEGPPPTPGISVVFVDDAYRSVDKVRLCAGGYADLGFPEVETSQTTHFNARVLRDGQPTNATVEFHFKESLSYQPALTPLIFATTNTWEKSWSGQTDQNGTVGLTIKSSDLIYNTELQAFWTNEQGKQVLVGSLPCEFGAARSYRRFENRFDPNEPEDTGWLFDFPNLSGPNATTPAKVYMKFQVREPDQDGNWKFVNGHDLLVKVVQVILQDGTVVEGTPEQLKDYAYVIDPTNSLAVTCKVTTGERINQEQRDGAASVTVKAGSKIDEADMIVLGADELTQWLP